MKRTNFIALDVHSTFCEGGHIDDAGREKSAWHEPTLIPELVKMIEAVPKPRKLVIEEGPLADWLYRNLSPKVDEMIVCEPASVARPGAAMGDGGGGPDDVGGVALGPMPVTADTTFAGRSFQYGDANDPMVIAMHPSAKYRSDGTAYDGSIAGDPSLVRENLRLENARRFVMSMCRDQQGRLWVGCENEQPGDGTGGVQCFDPSAPPLHQWTQYTIKDGLGDDNGYAIACDHQNRIWVGHLNHGVSVYNHNSKGHWQCYEVVAGLSRPDTLSGPIGERVFAIKCRPFDGDVWIATNLGLVWASPRMVGAAKDSRRAVRWSAHGKAEVHA